MSRVLKFRAWHSESDKMLYGTAAEVFKWQAEGQPVEIMQFTGFVDKNGTDVYEGDLVKYAYKFRGVYRESIAEIRWEHAGFTPSENKTKWHDFAFLNACRNLMEVAGNIYTP